MMSDTPTTEATPTTSEATAPVVVEESSSCCPICLEDTMYDSDYIYSMPCPNCPYNFCNRCMETFLVSSKDEYQLASDGSQQVKIHVSCPQCRSLYPMEIKQVIWLRQIHSLAQSITRPSTTSTTSTTSSTNMTPGPPILIQDSELTASQLRKKRDLLANMTESKQYVQQAHDLYVKAVTSSPTTTKPSPPPVIIVKDDNDNGNRNDKVKTKESSSPHHLLLDDDDDLDERELEASTTGDEEEKAAALKAAAEKIATEERELRDLERVKRRAILEQAQQVWQRLFYDPNATSSSSSSSQPPKSSTTTTAATTSTPSAGGTNATTATTTTSSDKPDGGVVTAAATTGPNNYLSDDEPSLDDINIDSDKDYGKLVLKSKTDIDTAASMADPTLFHMLDDSMSHEEQVFLTQLLTNGQASQLAQASMIIQGIMQNARQQSKLSSLSPSAAASAALALLSFSNSPTATTTTPTASNGNNHGHFNFNNNNNNNNNKKLSYLEQKEKTKLAFPLCMHMPGHFLIPVFTKRQGYLTLKDSEWKGVLPPNHSKGTTKIFDKVYGDQLSLFTEQYQKKQKERQEQQQRDGKAITSSTVVKIQGVRGPVGRLGLRKGDIITHVNDMEWMGSAQDLYDYIYALEEQQRQQQQQQASSNGGGDGSGGDNAGPIEISITVNANTETAQFLQLRHRLLVLAKVDLLTMNSKN